MSQIAISDVTGTGERRWGVILIDDADVEILRTVTSASKGEALSVAKALLNKGADAPLNPKEQDDSNYPAWISTELVSDGWLMKFSLLESSQFLFLVKPEGMPVKDDLQNKTFEVVRETLRKATIVWQPPEADPAYEEKEQDKTPTTGYPGS